METAFADGHLQRCLDQISLHVNRSYGGVDDISDEESDEEAEAGNAFEGSHSYRNEYATQMIPRQHLLEVLDYLREILGVQEGGPTILTQEDPVRIVRRFQRAMEGLEDPYRRIVPRIWFQQYGDFRGEVRRDHVELSPEHHEILRQIIRDMWDILRDTHLNGADGDIRCAVYRIFIDVKVAQEIIDAIIIRTGNRHGSRALNQIRHALVNDQGFDELDGQSRRAITVSNGDSIFGAIEEIRARGTNTPITTRDEQGPVTPRLRGRRLTFGERIIADNARENEGIQVSPIPSP